MIGETNHQTNTEKQTDQRRSALEAVTIEEVMPLTEPVQLIDYDPERPVILLRLLQQISEALGKTALRIEHVGSTGAHHSGSS